MVIIMDKEIIQFNLPELFLNIKSIKSGTNGQYRGLHSHSAIELVYVNEGKIECLVNDKIVTLSAGDTILINSYIIHKLSAKEFYDVTYIQIDLTKLIDSSGSNKKSYIDEYINHRNTMPYILSNGGELTELFKSIEKEAAERENSFELYIKAYFYQLAAFMSRHSLLSDGNGASQTTFEKIMPVISYIEDNYVSPLTLDLLASLIPCDKFTLCKLFKNATGGTVVDYITFVRIRKAYELLFDSDKSILEISLECGFASVQYFNRIFKQYAGCTPSTYRNTKLHHM